MQAIVTKYIGPGNVRGARMKATCERGSITIPYPDQSRDAHRLAREALVAKFVKEDADRHGTHRNPWDSPYAFGGLPKNGGEVHVSAGENPNQVIIEFASDGDYERFRKYLNSSRSCGSASNLLNGLFSSALKRARVGGIGIS